MRGRRRDASTSADLSGDEEVIRVLETNIQPYRLELRYRVLYNLYSITATRIIKNTFRISYCNPYFLRQK